MENEVIISVHCQDCGIGKVLEHSDVKTTMM